MPFGKRQISLPDFPVKRQPRSFHSVAFFGKFLLCRYGFSESHLYRQIKQYREVGGQAVRRKFVDGFQRPLGKAAAESLVSHGRVGIAFADDDLPEPEIFPDFFRCMLGSNGFVEKKFRFRADVAMRGVEQEFTDGFAEFRAARFAGMDNGKPQPSQITDDLIGLGRLPASFRTF